MLSIVALCMQLYIEKKNQLLHAIVLNCYVFMKGLIQFSEGQPIQNICPNYEV